MTRATRLLTLTVALTATTACARPLPDSAVAGRIVPPPFVSATQESFWNSLQRLCGLSFAGRLVEGNPSDSVFANSPVQMHVRQCGEGEIRIPLHVGENRSRTWIVTRTTSGLRLKHDHRHEDGSEDEITQYGGDTRDPGTATSQEFHADAHTAALIPYAATNIWSMAIDPGQRFTYGLRREGRRFRVEFDLTRPVPAPPDPWGYPPLR
jgi:hypothetical protein